MEQKQTGGEVLAPVVQADGKLFIPKGAVDNAEVIGRYRMECVGADGQVKWVEEFDNMVVQAGKSDMLSKYFTGSAYTAAWYFGLVSSATSYDPAHTLASHTGWTEDTNYSGTNRITAAFSAPTQASAGSAGIPGTAGTFQITTSAAASFSITGTTTINGALLCATQTIATTTGVLFSVGSFSGGNRAVVNGDTLNVSYTCTI